jgi:hypothetical protein
VKAPKRADTPPSRILVHKHPNSTERKTLLHLKHDARTHRIGAFPHKPTHTKQNKSGDRSCPNMTPAPTESAHFTHSRPNTRIRSQRGTPTCRREVSESVSTLRPDVTTHQTKQERCKTPRFKQNKSDDTLLPQHDPRTHRVGALHAQPTQHPDQVAPTPRKNCRQEASHSDARRCALTSRHTTKPPRFAHILPHLNDFARAFNA